MFCLLGLPDVSVQAETLRIATYNAELTRDGPGLLLRDILKGKDPQLIAVRDVVAQVGPDILVLQNVDFDHGLDALSALQAWLAVGGVDYPHIFALPPNSGVPTGLDMDGDGRLGRPQDAQGFGRFYGEGGMALLSRYPIEPAGVQDYSAMLWADLPGALLPETDGRPFPSADVQAVQRLSSVAHWVVPVQLPNLTLTLLAFHAGPPVFDGPEDRNGKRNHDELIFWQHYMDGAFGPVPDTRFVLLGDANLDPVDGDGLKPAILALLDDPRLQDPRPLRPDGPLADSPGQSGDPRLDTVAWRSPEPGHRRVDYILPSADLTVVQSGVHWPVEGDPAADTAQQASRHHVVWVDLRIK